MTESSLTELALVVASRRKRSHHRAGTVLGVADGESE
jgi:hypothetical protein